MNEFQENSTKNQFYAKNDFLKFSNFQNRLEIAQRRPFVHCYYENRTMIGEVIVQTRQKGPMHRHTQTKFKCGGYGKLTASRLD